jgi:hypothetical protein
LDDEQREQVRDCLVKGEASLVEPFDKFISRIESSINHFSTATSEGGFREAHDALREIWLLSRNDDPSPALLRARLKSLLPLALEYLARRARAVLPRLFPGEEIDGEAFEPPACLAANLFAWAERAEGAKLVTALRVLSADGGRWVGGRSRGGGNRSALRFEPQVLGVTRGSPEPKPKGGRPREDARFELIMHLAMDWHHATGEEPRPGRSDYTDFGDLVHSVFQWLGLPEGSATHLLRRYRASVKNRKTRPSLEDFLKRYGEEL